MGKGKLFGGRSVTVTLTPMERLAVIEGIRIGLEDGSLEHLTKYAESASQKVNNGFDKEPKP